LPVNRILDRGHEDRRYLITDGVACPGHIIAPLQKRGAQPLADEA
jgi:hypothetical protein